MSSELTNLQNDVTTLETNETAFTGDVSRIISDFVKSQQAVIAAGGSVSAQDLIDLEKRVTTLSTNVATADQAVTTADPAPVAPVTDAPAAPAS